MNMKNCQSSSYCDVYCHLMHKTCNLQSFQLIFEALLICYYQILLLNMKHLWRVLVLDILLIIFPTIRSESAFTPYYDFSSTHDHMICSECCYLPLESKVLPCISLYWFMGKTWTLNYKVLQYWKSIKLLLLLLTKFINSRLTLIKLYL